MKVLAKVGAILLIWILIPVGLGFAGYFFIGPNLGKNGWFGNVAKSIAKVTPLPKPDSQLPDTVQSTEASEPKPDGPEVEVTVSKSTGRSRSNEEDQPVRPKKRKKRVSVPKPVEEPAVTPERDPASEAPRASGDGPPTTAPPDEGGSGGAGDGRDGTE